MYLSEQQCYWAQRYCNWTSRELKISRRTKIINTRWKRRINQHYEKHWKERIWGKKWEWYTILWHWTFHIWRRSQESFKKFDAHVELTVVTCSCLRNNFRLMLGKMSFHICQMALIPTKNLLKFLFQPASSLWQWSCHNFQYWHRYQCSIILVFCYISVLLPQYSVTSVFYHISVLEHQCSFTSLSYCGEYSCQLKLWPTNAYKNSRFNCHFQESSTDYIG